MVAADVRTALTGLRRHPLRDLVASPRALPERVQARVDHGFSDLSVTRDLYDQFANADVDDEASRSPKPVIIRLELAELISRRLDERSVSGTPISDQRRARDLSPRAASNLSPCALSLSKGDPSLGTMCLLSLSKGTIRRVP